MSETSVLRQLFGTNLKTLRERNRRSADHIAGILRITDATVRRWERGAAFPRLSELEKLLDLYRIWEADERQLLSELYEQAPTARLWHSRLRLPEVMSRLHGFEIGARAVTMFDSAAVPGLLQTEAYAYAHIQACEPAASEEYVKRQVELRMERPRPPAIRVLLTERAIRDQVGDAEVMREQVRFIYSGPYGARVRVLREDPTGSFTIIEHEQRAAVYAESPVCNFYTGDEAVVRPTFELFQRYWDAALPERESSKLILSVLKGL